VPHRSPDDATEHITTALVARQDPIADEERGGAAVIGDDLDGDVLFRVAAVAVTLIRSITPITSWNRSIS